MVYLMKIWWAGRLAPRGVLGRLWITSDKAEGFSVANRPWIAHYAVLAVLSLGNRRLFQVYAMEAEGRWLQHVCP
jgi:hypothetical protein